jgi:copper chaperone NosL
VKTGAFAAALVVLAACGSGVTPAALMTGVGCAHCRMTVSDPGLAAQLVAPGEEPQFFDDIGCLAAFLRDHPADAGWSAYVADHATGVWIPANDAVYSRAEEIATPMGSHLVAHASDAARAADPAVHGAARLAPRDVFGASGAPGGRR